MRPRSCVLAFSLFPLLTGCLPAPNYRVWEPHPDNPISHTKHYTQPAVAWDVEYLAVSLAASTVLTPLGSCLGLGLGPHLAGWAQHQYHPSLHWAFTLSDRCGSVAWQHGQTVKLAWITSTLLLAGYDR